MEARINRILDASRRTVPKPLGRAMVVGLSVAVRLLVYAVAVVQLAPAQVLSQRMATIPDKPQPQLVVQAGPQRTPAHFGRRFPRTPPWVP